MNAYLLVIEVLYAQQAFIKQIDFFDMYRDNILDMVVDPMIRK